MRLSHNIRGYLIAILILVCAESESSAADTIAFDWLRGSGSDLEMRLRGEAIEENGDPAKEIQVIGQLNTRMGKRDLKADINGNRFEIWIPVNQTNWHSMQLSASSTQSESVAYLMISASKLREAVVKDVKLTLRKPTRRVDIKVVDKGQPVSGATVKIELGYGVELLSRTDESGTAQFRLLPDRKLSHLKAWTDDFRLGGYNFSRGPVRDPSVDEHLIELSACREQKFRFVDQDGAPVAGITFLLNIATPPPDYNYIGSNEHSVMTTDASGEATTKWFPDWKQHHFYPDLWTDQWVVDGELGQSHKTVGDILVYKVKKSKIAGRKRVTGQVKSNRTRVGGFHVTLDSFQGEQQGQRDVLGVFTDADGSFAIDVLPDATYCIYVLDGRWVGNIIDAIPYESSIKRVNSPVLTVSEGLEAEVVVTSGPDQRPYPNLAVSFQRTHQFKFQEDGRMRGGSSGPQWWATTDENGRAVTHTLPGELKVSIYTPLWRTEQTVKVKTDEPVTIYLHREIDEKRPVAGRLVISDGIQASLEGALIKVGSIDGASREEHRLTCGEDGRFAFETLSSQLGIFATTKDGRLAGSLTVQDLTQPIELRLVPTVDFQGKVVTQSGDPIAGQKIHAVARVEGKKPAAGALSTKGGSFPNLFDVQQFETVSDEIGHYTLKGMPTNLRILMWTNAIDGSSGHEYLGDVHLQPNDSRPREVSRLGKKSQEEKKVAIAKRYRTTLRDCGLSGYRPLVIIAGENASVAAFIEKNFRDSEANPDVYAFMPIIASNPDTEDEAFLNERNWQQPGEGRIGAYALDSQGHILGQIEIDIADPNAAKNAAEFVHRHAPAKSDAEKKWNEAFAEAKRTNRRVWVRVSQRYCGPCFLLTRWLDDQRTTLEKDYVMLKIDDAHDQNANRVTERVTLGGRHGVPFSAIFDAYGERLVDSVGPLGNVGFPSGVEGNKQLRQMLFKSKTNITDAEIEMLVESVDNPNHDADDR